MVSLNILSKIVHNIKIKYVTYNTVETFSFSVTGLTSIVLAIDDVTAVETSHWRQIACVHPTLRLRSLGRLINLRINFIRYFGVGYFIEILNLK